MKKLSQTLSNIDWTTTLWLVLTPLFAIALGTLHIQDSGVSGLAIFYFLLFYMLSGLSISAGYHRLFSHLTYESSPLVRIFFLFFGAGTFEGPAIKWATDHRRHHRSVDTEEDPYNINQGFWYAHLGWLIYNESPKYAKKFERDLAQDKWVMLQYRYYVPLAILSGFGLPTLLGALLGNAYEGFLFGGLIRIVILQHTTFFVNSACHYFGRRPYNLNNSARDSWWLALITNGEGYHNYHHRFQSDYRNGVRWFHWDPAKWLIFSLQKMGLATRLKKIPDFEIFKARLATQEKRLIQNGWKIEVLAAFRKNVELSYQKMKQQYEVAKKKHSLKAEAWVQVKMEFQKAKQEFRRDYLHWVSLYKQRYPLPV